MSYALVEHTHTYSDHPETKGEISYPTAWYRKIGVSINLSLDLQKNIPTNDLAGSFLQYLSLSPTTTPQIILATIFRVAE